MFQHDLRRKSSMCDAPLSISTIENKSNNIQVYPNPASQSFTILSEDLGELQIRTITGEFVSHSLLTQPKTTFNISNLASGIYIINIQTPNYNFVQKLIKE
jgi:hypothetical protein